MVFSGAYQEASCSAGLVIRSIGDISNAGLSVYPIIADYMDASQRRTFSMASLTHNIDAHPRVRQQASGVYTGYSYSGYSYSEHQVLHGHLR
jgi:hypothetical protein